jgi:hypothetical protein
MEANVLSSQANIVSHAAKDDAALADRACSLAILFLPK